MRPARRRRSCGRCVPDHGGDPAGPGAVAHDAEGRVVSVFALDVAAGVVQAIRAVVNPDKLGHLGPVADLARLPENKSQWEGRPTFKPSRIAWRSKRCAASSPTRR